MAPFFALKWEGNFKNTKSYGFFGWDWFYTNILDFHRQLKGIKKLHRNVLSNKKSDTIFVFGSGESINQLSEKDWSIIKKHNTMGLNYSFVHDLVPDCFLMELIPDEEMQKFLIEDIQNRYKDVVFSFQYKHLTESGFDIKRYPFQDNVYCHIPRKYPTTNKEVLNKVLNYLIPKYKFESNKLVHHNSHIGCAIWFAFSMGFKNVVLLGVDLNGGDYFTDSKISSTSFPATKSYTRLNEIRKSFYKRRNEDNLKTHQTMDHSMTIKNNSVLMLDYFRLFSSNLNEFTDKKLFVGNESSALAEFLPVFNFKD